MPDVFSWVNDPTMPFIVIGGLLLIGILWGWVRAEIRKTSKHDWRL